MSADQTNQEAVFTESKAVEGFYVGVGSEKLTATTTVDQRLHYAVWTTKNDDPEVYVPKEPEYACRIELYDTNGVSISKTERGKRFGLKYYDLDTSFSNKGAKLSLMVVPKKSKAWPLLFLLCPKDSFNIVKPGKYSLHIHFQIIVRTGKGKDKTAHIVRFPVLHYSLVKE